MARLWQQIAAGGILIPITDEGHGADLAARPAKDP